MSAALDPITITASIRAPHINLKLFFPSEIDHKLHAVTIHMTRISAY
jgi:hypothetical protein